MFVLEYSIRICKNGLNLLKGRRKLLAIDRRHYPENLRSLSMGSRMFRRAMLPKDASIRAASIEKYHSTLTRLYAVREAIGPALRGYHQPNNYKPRTTIAYSIQTRRTIVKDASRSVVYKTTTSTAATPNNRNTAKLRCDTALRATTLHNKKASAEAVDPLVYSTASLTRAAWKCVKAHPLETAAVIIPFTVSACTPFILDQIGFTTGGVAPGMIRVVACLHHAYVNVESVAAGIQARIGNVAPGSAFAVLTSAAMGGDGTMVVYGSAWAVPAALMSLIVAWKRRRGI